MPKLTDLVEGKIEHSNRDVCPHCQKRKPTIYVQGRALVLYSEGPTNAGRSANAQTSRTFKSLPGIYLCRQCATEALERIGQVLGVSEDAEAR